MRESYSDRIRPKRSRHCGASCLWFRDGDLPQEQRDMYSKNNEWVRRNFSLYYLHHLIYCLYDTLQVLTISEINTQASRLYEHTWQEPFA